MTLNHEVEYEKVFPFEPESLAFRVAVKCLDYEACPYEAEVNLLLTSDTGIRQLNKQFRNMNKATDVLSFPLMEFERPADFSRAEEQKADHFNPETGELLLGDIVISKDKVTEQAKEYGHSEEREFAFLIAHSMLHLMGYDHLDAEEAREMEKRQAEILEQLQIRR